MLVVLQREKYMGEEGWSLLRGSVLEGTIYG